MAAFTQEDISENRLDWKILRDGGISLYWRREFLEQDIVWFSQQSYQVFRFDCGLWVSREEMHTDFLRTLNFPAYYGRNLDALSDCLGDLPVPSTSGTALALIRFDAYLKGAGAHRVAAGRREAEMVLDVLAEASRRFLLTAKRFLVLVQTDDTRIQIDNLGCISAQWNWREWQNKNRGL
jgi:hypothetical protein